MTISKNVCNNSYRPKRGTRLTPMYNVQCFSCSEEHGCQVREVV